MAKGLQRRRGSLNGGAWIGFRQCIICVMIVSVSAVAWFQFRFSRNFLSGDARISGISTATMTAGDESPLPGLTRSANEAHSVPWQCTFREYPPRRYYHLDEKLPFLQDSEYIYGTSPVLLEGIDLMANEGKICVKQTLEKETTRPFSDGTNPSILRMDRLPATHALSIAMATQQKNTDLFLGSTCITDGQCSWKDTNEEKSKYQISSLEQQTSKYAKILILDSKLHTLLETTLMLELDAPWGRRSRQARRDPKARNGFAREAKAFDDARLFLHNSQVWVTYREGPGFGYEQQVLNPIHFEIASDKSMDAYVKASETTSFCCGRNMALVSDGKPNSPLSSLTWVDPVTMVDVDDGTKDAKSMEKQQRRRRLRERKSDFHGTNGFLISLETTNEFLGIGHFHRPPGRDTSDYARHGHHYTHSFFAITAAPPHRLTRLSQEFVFETKSKAHAGKNVTDMIQFASGADLIGSDINGKLLVVYGINDCEGASKFLDMKIVQSMLKPVQEGQQVVDLMKKLE